MKYTMTTPCNQCPFLEGSGFTKAQLNRHARGEFGCHKACELREDDEGFEQFEPTKDTPHCAGALIYLEKRGKPHQMMRIAERLGMYNHTNLDMKAKVQ